MLGYDGVLIWAIQIGAKLLSVAMLPLSWEDRLAMFAFQVAELWEIARNLKINTGG